jgi:hypothetical protein
LPYRYCEAKEVGGDARIRRARKAGILKELNEDEWMTPGLSHEEQVGVEREDNNADLPVFLCSSSGRSATVHETAAMTHPA